MTRRTSSIVALALTATAISAAPAAASQDLRMPDRRDTGVAGAPVQDLRMPDRRAPFVLAAGTSPVAGSPARGREAGLDWSDAGLGAGAAIALVMLVAGGATVTRRHGAGLKGV